MTNTPILSGVAPNKGQHCSFFRNDAQVSIKVTPFAGLRWKAGQIWNSGEGASTNGKLMLQKLMWRTSKHDRFEICWAAVIIWFALSFRSWQHFFTRHGTGGCKCLQWSACEPSRPLLSGPCSRFGDAGQRCFCGGSILWKTRSQCLGYRE